MSTFFKLSQLKRYTLKPNEIEHAFFCYGSEIAGGWSNIVLSLKSLQGRFRE